MKRLPVRAVSQPINGQPATSLLATKVTGSKALMTKMSRKEMWFATITPFPNPAAWKDSAANLTPSAPTSPADQRRLMRTRAISGKNENRQATQSAPASR